MNLGGRVFWCGRLAVRAAFSAGLVDVGAIATENPAVAARPFCTKTGNTVPSQNAAVKEPLSRVVTSCAGFPKDLLNGPSKALEQGVYGDDACFTTRFNNTYVVGVADGVGGWRRYGVDPSLFSKKLMKECEKRVQKGDFVPSQPARLLEAAFNAMFKNPKPVGSSTACVLVVDEYTLYSANLGDSGFMVVRDGKVLHKSSEQTHYFNAPFQLAIAPEGVNGCISNHPSHADKEQISVRSGDMVVVATDGLWDNLSEAQIIEQLRAVDGEASVQEVCNSIALTARRLAFDQGHNSPFAKRAREAGYAFPGGKPDDITLVLLLIT